MTTAFGDTFTISIKNDKLVTIFRNGDIETGPGYTPTLAAMALWSAVSDCMPGRREELLLAKVRAALWREVDPEGNDCCDFGSMIDTVREVLAMIDAAYPFPPGEWMTEIHTRTPDDDNKETDS